MTNNKPNDVRVVPRELTPEMIKADPYGLGYGRLHAIWSALLDAAEVSQPADQQGEPVAWLNEATGHVTTSSVVVMDWDDEKEPVQSLYRHTQPATAKVVLPERETLKDVMAAVIGGDAYDCTRAWSAWGVGTMTDDDFVPIVEQEERLYELVDACLDEVARLNTLQ